MKDNEPLLVEPCARIYKIADFLNGNNDIVKMTTQIERIRM